VVFFHWIRKSKLCRAPGTPPGVFRYWTDGELNPARWIRKSKLATAPRPTAHYRASSFRGGYFWAATYARRSSRAYLTLRPIRTAGMKPLFVNAQSVRGEMERVSAASGGRSKSLSEQWSPVGVGSFIVFSRFSDDIRTGLLPV